MKNNVIIFTDGSSKGNPGPGGWGSIIAWDENVREIGGREEQTTNNRMELRAALESLKFFEKQKSDAQEILIYTDSSYLIQGITKWVKGWVKNGWLTTQEEPVVNDDIWKELIGVVEKLEEKSKIKWIHLKGHVGIPGNERVDEIATAFADKEQVELYNGSQKEYSLNLYATTGDKVKKIISLEKKERARQKAYSYVSLVDGEIQIHKTWAECEKRVKGVSGAKFKKTISLTDEKAIIAEWQKQKSS